MLNSSHVHRLRFQDLSVYPGFPHAVECDLTVAITVIAISALDLGRFCHIHFAVVVIAVRYYPLTCVSLVKILNR